MDESLAEALEVIAITKRESMEATEKENGNGARSKSVS